MLIFICERFINELKGVVSGLGMSEKQQKDMENRINTVVHRIIQKAQRGMSLLGMQGVSITNSPKKAGE